MNFQRNKRLVDKALHTPSGRLALFSSEPYTSPWNTHSLSSHWAPSAGLTLPFTVLLLLPLSVSPDACPLGNRGLLCEAAPGTRTSTEEPCH